tara:strand:- start:14889 stop:15749 length:861 start_codon:yes stop_codon:yes gene_type:complete
MDIVEQATPQDYYYNYCWWPYQPQAPTDGKIRASSLLFHSFALTGVFAPARQICETMRTEIGCFRTVYGVKWAEGKLSWEYYLYDYKRENRNVSMSRVFQALQPHLECSVPFPEDRPYFMFSFDLDPDLMKTTPRVDKVNMYIGNPGSTVSSGISYGLTPEKTEMENLYFFFDARSQMSEVLEKLRCSAFHRGDDFVIENVLHKELRNCHTICLANKRNRDTVYYSGVGVQQLRWFLEAFNYPAEITDFVAAHQHQLDHLLFDVGFDYQVVDGRAKAVKSGFYAVF